MTTSPLDKSRAEPLFRCDRCEGTLFRPTPTGLVCANCRPAPSDEKAGQEVEFALIATYQDFAAAPSVPSEGGEEIEKLIQDVISASESLDYPFQAAAVRSLLAAFRTKQEQIELERFCTDRETNSHEETMRLVGELNLKLRARDERVRELEALLVPSGEIDLRLELSRLRAELAVRLERVRELERELGDINKIFARYLNTATPGEITELRAEIQILTSANKRLAENLAYVCKCALDNELEAAQTIQRLKEQQEGK